MSRVLIFGNSGSGKSTLAKEISTKNNVAHLDLDTIAWKATSPPTRTPISESEIQINNFRQSRHPYTHYFKNNLNIFAHLVDFVDRNRQS